LIAVADSSREIPNHRLNQRPTRSEKLVRNVKLPSDAPRPHRSADTSSPYLVEIRSDIDEQYLRETWLDFESSASAFQRLSFVESLYRQASAQGKREPVIVSVRERRSGLIILIAALSRRRRFGLTIVEAADCSLCDYFVPLTSPGRLFDADEVRSMWAEICRALQPADAIIIKKIPDDMFGYPNIATQFPGLKSMGSPARAIRLNAGPCASPGWRKRAAFKDAAKKLRRMQRHGSVVFDFADSPAEIAAAFDQLVYHRMRRFERLRRSDLLQEEGIVQFYRALAERGLTDGSARVFRLKLNGELLAVAFVLLHRHTMSMVILTMTAEKRWEPFSPGLVATKMLADWAEANGLSYLDISVGDFSYKARMTSSVRPLYELSTALSARGALAVANAALRRRYRAFMSAYPGLDGYIRLALKK
jgi:CelD/BcsL family acetyltransferase involved in cellulose biosynthesis